MDKILPDVIWHQIIFLVKSPYDMRLLFLVNKQLNKILNNYSEIIQYPRFNDLCVPNSRYCLQWLIINRVHGKMYYFIEGCSVLPTDIVKWLYNRCQITNEEIKSNLYSAFTGACLSNRTDTAKWLHQNFHITEEVQIYSAFSCSCYYGNIDTIKWLYRTFHITEEMIASDNYTPFVKTCKMGHLETAKWFYYTFGIPTMIIQKLCNEVFCGPSCYMGFFEVAVWLYNEHMV